MGSEQVEMEQEARPQSLEEALVTHLQEMRELEELLFRQYEREEALLVSIKRRDDEIAKLKARLTSTARTAATRLEQLKATKKQYRNLSGSKLGRVQRAWWRMRSGKKKPHTDEAKER